MATTKTMYLANDGASFETEAEANKHEEALEDAKAIEAYVAAAGLKKAQATLVKGHIAKFLAHVDAQRPQAG